MYPIIRKIATISAFVCLVNCSMAQDPGPKSKTSAAKAEAKPFRILTDGQRIIIQSKQDIQRIMAWTTSGHRIVEQINPNSPYSFTVPNTEKYLFVMIQLKNGKYYTEKIGVQ